MKKIMLVNVVEPEETRIAILEDGTLEELYIERSSSGQIAGNVYKGKITNVEPALQAAFVELGVPRNGFLHLSDVKPSYYQEKKEGGATHLALVANQLQRVLPPSGQRLLRLDASLSRRTKDG